MLADSDTALCYDIVVTIVCRKSEFFVCVWISSHILYPLSSERWSISVGTPFAETEALSLSVKAVAGPHKHIEL